MVASGTRGKGKEIGKKAEIEAWRSLLKILKCVMYLIYIIIIID
jgi:hypothetical protein